MIENNESNIRESWLLEIILSILLGLPWYWFSGSIMMAAIIHFGLIVAYVSLVVFIFGRGSAVMSFLFIGVLSVLCGLVLVGLSGGRIFM